MALLYIFIPFLPNSIPLLLVSITFLPICIESCTQKLAYFHSIPTPFAYCPAQRNIITHLVTKSYMDTLLSAIDFMKRIVCYLEIIPPVQKLKSKLEKRTKNRF